MAGLLFGVAFAFACIAISGFLLERTVFRPETTLQNADLVLENETVRAELVRTISDATIQQLTGGDAAQGAVIERNVEIVAGTRAGSVLLAEVLHDAHAHLIGRQEEPVQITSQQLVQVLRDERAAALPPVELPVPRLGVLAVVDDALDWLVPAAAIAAGVFFLLCLLAHPEKAGLTRSLGIGLVVLAALTVIFGWLVPAFVPPLLTDSAWAEMPTAIANATMPVVVGGALVLVGLGLGLMAVAARIRRSRRWSAPVNTYRYREERSWS